MTEAVLMESNGVWRSPDRRMAITRSAYGDNQIGVWRLPSQRMAIIRLAYAAYQISVWRLSNQRWTRSRFGEIETLLKSQRPGLSEL